MLWDRSNTAPAVLGLDSLVWRDGVSTRGITGSVSIFVMVGIEMMEEMLPDTE